MRKLTFTIILIIMPVLLSAQPDKFERIYEIPVPVIENTGFGEFVAGVDFDQDGNPEIYAVNNMLDQGGSEEIPKIFKFELHNGQWDSVWSATLTNIPQQNSWGPLIAGDWDNDGKPDLIWCPANWLSGMNPNPSRIVVFEYPGDGSDNMGVNFFGNFVPNAQWSITSTDNEELRPFRLQLQDVDNDGDLELCFADRRDNYRYGVVSVSDIPDAGDGSETWTLETSGFGKIFPPTIGTAYDISVIDNKMYVIFSNGEVAVVEYQNGTWADPAILIDKVPGGSWKSSSTVDVNNDGKEEIYVGGWFDSGFNIFVLQPDPVDTLKTTAIYNYADLLGPLGKLNGGTYGDIDLDGNMDIFFGSRTSEPRAAIVRMEYQGGPVDSSSSYEVAIIDSLFPSDDSFEQYDIVRVGNVDEDPELEVFYTDGARIGRTPIVVLDLQTVTSVYEDIIPSDLYLDQNYPNPFNPSTTIRFGLNKQMNVDLRIYDILGRQAAVLINSEVKPAGTYEITFNASSAANGLASGTYVYKLTAGQNSISKKMILMK